MSGLMKSSTKLIPGSYARTLINALGIAQFSDHLNEDAYASPMLRNVLTALLASKGRSVSMPSQISASPISLFKRDLLSFTYFRGILHIISWKGFRG